MSRFLFYQKLCRHFTFLCKIPAELEQHAFFFILRIHFDFDGRKHHVPAELLDFIFKNVDGTAK